MTTESLLVFPCSFPIKAMGRAGAGLDQVVLGILRPHVPDLDPTNLTVAASKQGNYESITVTINATSQAQLDAIYQGLSDHELVLMAL